jgi:superfamily II DNA/RNA helicase
VIRFSFFVIVQALVIAPTRELAVQIRDVISTLGKFVKGLVCNVFIGGLARDVRHTFVAFPIFHFLVSLAFSE